MLYENVNFNEEEIRKMTREEFESRHINLFWQDRDEATRKIMLDKAFDLITKPAGQSKKKSGK